MTATWAWPMTRLQRDRQGEQPQTTNQVSGSAESEPDQGRHEQQRDQDASQIAAAVANGRRASGRKSDREQRRVAVEGRVVGAGRLVVERLAGVQPGAGVVVGVDVRERVASSGAGRASRSRRAIPTSIANRRTRRIRGCRPPGRASGPEVGPDVAGHRAILVARPPSTGNRRPRRSGRFVLVGGPEGPVLRCTGRADPDPPVSARARRPDRIADRSFPTRRTPIPPTTSTSRGTSHAGHGLQRRLHLDLRRGRRPDPGRSRSCRSRRQRPLAAAGVAHPGAVHRGPRPDDPRLGASRPSSSARSPRR